MAKYGKVVRTESWTMAQDYGSRYNYKFVGVALGEGGRTTFFYFQQIFD